MNPSPRRTINRYACEVPTAFLRGDLDTAAEADQDNQEQHQVPLDRTKSLGPCGSALSALSVCRRVVVPSLKMLPQQLVPGIAIRQRVASHEVRQGERPCAGAGSKKSLGQSPLAASVPVRCSCSPELRKSTAVAMLVSMRASGRQILCAWQCPTGHGKGRLPGISEYGGILSVADFLCGSRHSHRQY